MYSGLARWLSSCWSPGGGCWGRNPGGGSGVIWPNSPPIGPIGPGSIGPPGGPKTSYQLRHAAGFTCSSQIKIKHLECFLIWYNPFIHFLNYLKYTNLNFYQCNYSKNHNTKKWTNILPKNWVILKNRYFTILEYHWECANIFFHR